MKPELAKQFLILSEGYHAWHDEFTSLTPPANGVPPVFDYIEKLDHRLFECHIEEAAAVIVEPVITDYSNERIAWLRRLRDLCTKFDTVLIFDETITALRFPNLSVANWCGVRPDITIMGKALGAGFPLSVVGGNKDIMDSDYFVSSTFAGDTISMKASMALLDILKGEGIVDRMWLDGEKFVTEFNKINPEIIYLEAYPTRGVFKAKDELTKALFMQLCIKAGVLFHPTSWFWHYKMNEESFDVLEICRAAVHLIEHNQVELEGEIPVQPFSQKVRE